MPRRICNLIPCYPAPKLALEPCVDKKTRIQPVNQRLTFALSHPMRWSGWTYEN